jgi:hypothetical protein
MSPTRACVGAKLKTRPTLPNVDSAYSRSYQMWPLGRVGRVYSLTVHMRASRAREPFQPFNSSAFPVAAGRPTQTAQQFLSYTELMHRKEKHLSFENRKQDTGENPEAMAQAESERGRAETADQ